MINLNNKVTSAIAKSITFLKKCRVDESWEFLPHLGAEKPTLYSSAFAAMSYFYTQELNKLSALDIQLWGEFLSNHQSSTDGLFESSELFESPGIMHSLEHRKLHLTCHILPAMEILGIKPKHRINYINKYKCIKEIKSWLNQIDLSQSWIEGNNLLFMGQLLWFEYINFKDKEAKASLDFLMEWLDATVDPKTGLWGTDKACPLHHSMYGSYHQLILYFYQGKEPLFIDKLIDSTLLCQHFDGGFNNGLGGGTCQDIDGIDILVKTIQLTSYRANDIELSLRQAIVHITRDRQASSGGFIDSPGRTFIHNSMPATLTEANVANTFSTWFTIHALANISPIIGLDLNLNYNNSLSMGWGVKKPAKKNKTTLLLYKLKTKAFLYSYFSKLVICLYKIIKKKKLRN